MAGEEEGKEAQEGGEDTKGGSKKMLIIIVVVVLLLVIGGAGAFFALSGAKGGEEGDEGDEEEEYEDDGAELPGALFPMETFIVNLGVKGSFLKTQIQLEFIEPELPHTIENDVPKVRDAVIQVLSAKSATEILSFEGKEGLRKEVRDAINDSLGGEEVIQIYFTEFIVQ